MKRLVINHGRTLLLVASVALIAVGVGFFIQQDLSSADQYASVASFFVGVVGLAVSSISLIHGRQDTARAADDTGDGPFRPASSSHTSNVIINKANGVQTGGYSTMHLSRDAPADAPTTQEPHQERDER